MMTISGGAGISSKLEPPSDEPLPPPLVLALPPLLRMYLALREGTSRGFVVGAPPACDVM
jgi:hypothetical protein